MVEGRTLWELMERRAEATPDALMAVDEDMRTLGETFSAAGRNLAELEMVGGTRAVFPDDHSPADLGRAMAAIPAQLEAGFTTFALKPSQYVDDVADLERFCADVIRRAEAMANPD